MTSARDVLSSIGLLQPARNVHKAARRALALALHPVREAICRLPDPWFLLTGREPLQSPYREHLSELNRDGITRISGEIPAAMLAELQQSFEKFVARLAAAGVSSPSSAGDMTLADEYFDPESRQYSSNEPFIDSRALLEVCLKPELVSLINGYLGKQAYITQGVALRIEPNPRTGFGSFQWHHDAWGKRINMMIVLTEVGERDQFMTYAKGSHRLRHSYDKYANSRYSPQEFAARCGRFEVLNCLARPGDIYIFDSNGIHSGNRTDGRARDVFIVEFTRQSQAVWAHRIPPGFLAGFSEQQLRPLKWILRQDRRKRPLAPPVNSWVGGLLRVDKWLS
jgi:Phytanoyl-CoA dioxygenase (PhyH)